MIRRKKNIFIDLLKMLKMFLKQQKYLRLEKCLSHDQTGLKKKKKKVFTKVHSRSRFNM